MSGEVYNAFPANGLQEGLGWLLAFAGIAIELISILGFLLNGNISTDQKKELFQSLMYYHLMSSMAMLIMQGTRIFIGMDPTNIALNFPIIRTAVTWGGTNLLADIYNEGDLTQSNVISLGFNVLINAINLGLFAYAPMKVKVFNEQLRNISVIHFILFFINLILLVSVS